MSSVFEFYTAGYFLWCLYSRDRRAPKQAAAPPGKPRRSWCRMFLTDLGHAVALYWILLNVRMHPQALTHDHGAASRPQHSWQACQQKSISTKGTRLDWHWEPARRRMPSQCCWF
jgi:hypothetical protein